MGESEYDIFIDNCIFLHYPPLKDIDWCALCGVKRVRLIVCMPALHELDKWKADHRYQHRAQRAIREIEAIMEAGGAVRDGVVLECIEKTYRREEFPPDLDPESRDDQTLLNVVRHTKNQIGDIVAVATEDIGMRVKCKARGVSVVCPGTNLRLENPGDKQSKQLHRLQQEYSELKYRQPSLAAVFWFSDDAVSDTASFKLSDPAVVQLLDIAEIRRKVPKRYPPRPTEGGIYNLSLNDFNPLGRIPTSEYDRYNREVDTYLANCERHNQELLNWSDLNARVVVFDCGLNNSGSAPATNVDVRFSFPEGMTAGELNILIQPPAPPLPVPPRTELNMMGSASILNPFLGSVARTSMDNVSKPTIRQGRIYEVRYNVQRSKQHDPLKLGKLVAVFPTRDSVGSFHTDYRITAEEVPQPVTGELHFRFGDDERQGVRSNH